MKVLVMLLTTNKIQYLHISYQSVINQYDNMIDYDIVINVNSLDEKYYESVCNHFSSNRDHNLIIIKTQSNGKPGQGHNSCIQYFLENKMYDYLVIVDGDDFLYPYAFHQLEKILVKKPVAINLYRHDILRHLSSELYIYEDSEKPRCKYNLELMISNDKPKTKDDNVSSLIECNNIYLFDDGIGTPTRLFCVSRDIENVIDKYGKLYDDDMYLFDDLKTFLIMFEEQYLNNDIIFLHDPHIYLYNKLNSQSISLNIDRYHNDIKYIHSKYESQFPQTQKWQTIDINVQLLQKPDIENIDKYKCQFLKFILKNGTIDSIFPII